MKKKYSNQEFKERKVAKSFQRRTSKIFVNIENQYLASTSKKKKVRDVEEEI